MTRAGSWVTSCFCFRNSRDVRFWFAAIGRSMKSADCFLMSRSIFDQTFCVALISVSSEPYSYRYTARL